jgi:hypothetical protein
MRFTGSASNVRDEDLTPISDDFRQAWRPISNPAFSDFFSSSPLGRKQVNAEVNIWR